MCIFFFFNFLCSLAYYIHNFPHISYIFSFISRILFFSRVFTIIINTLWIFISSFFNVKEKYRERDVSIGASPRREAKQLKRAIDRARFYRRYFFWQEKRRDHWSIQDESGPGRVGDPTRTCSQAAAASPARRQLVRTPTTRVGARLRGPSDRPVKLTPIRANGG